MTCEKCASWCGIRDLKTMRTQCCNLDVTKTLAMPVKDPWFLTNWDDSCVFFYPKREAA